MTGCVEGIRRAPVLGLVLKAGTAIEQAPFVVYGDFNGNSITWVVTKTTFGDIINDFMTDNNIIMFT